MAPTLAIQPAADHSYPFGDSRLPRRDSLLGDRSLQNTFSSTRRLHTSVRRSESMEALLERARQKQQARQSSERNREEIAWLREHKRALPGQWVALIGLRLIATGTSAREVYAQIDGAHLESTPLVTQIESGEELPFAGW